MENRVPAQPKTWVQIYQGQSQTPAALLSVPEASVLELPLLSLSYGAGLLQPKMH